MSAETAQSTRNTAGKLGLFLVVVTTVLTAACTSKPVPVISNEQLHQHSTAYIRQAIRADNLSDICQSISHDSNSEAQSLYQQWLEQEWNVIIGADSFYRTTLSGETLVFDNQILAMEALRLYADETERSSASFSYLARVKMNPERTCLRKMRETLAPLALTEGARTKLVAQAIRHPAPPARGDRIPSLAGSFTIDATAGRSLYKIEQSTKNMSCSSPKIITFQNKWPSEIYGIFCNNDHKLVSCDWGQCRTL